MSATRPSPIAPQVSVIVPARNEEASLGACLESLVSQSGVDFEIIVVDDHSTDRTREIAESFPKVQVIEARPLPESWTGKNNAVALGAREARAQWLLFTDADTVHSPGSLARALAEAIQNKADMLSYSPEQVTVGFWELAVLPVVFAELARQYPPSKVSDPKSPEAAANGQYILIRRETYTAIGGHGAVASEILEDVALARLAKSSGFKLRFRYSESVRTRMYRTFAQLREGWTKNLALLFPNPGWLATKTLFWWALSLGLICATALVALVFGVTSSVPSAYAAHHAIAEFFASKIVWLICSAVLAAVLVRNLRLLRRANFNLIHAIRMAIFGMPIFAYLLLRSKRMHTEGNVAWKGRTYQATPRITNSKEPDSITSRKAFMKTPLVLILLTIVLTVLGPIALRAQSADQEPHFANTMIEPGQRVGPLKINDSRDRALELFPKKDIDQEWEDPCGNTIDWTDSTNPVGHGDVFIRMKKGKVFQIESSTTRFHTAEDITTFDSPDKVAQAYKDMRAYVLLTAPNPAIGSRPLVFWVDKKKGIAFALAFDPSHHKRYVYKIIVFEPNKNFCPEQETINSTKWQSLAPYAVEPSAELSPER
jgi:glycosyltransferase involved in cell wall biosynthesis